MGITALLEVSVSRLYPKDETRITAFRNAFDISSQFPSILFMLALLKLSTLKAMSLKSERTRQLFSTQSLLKSKPLPILLTGRGRTTEKSRAVIRCAARGRWFPPRASTGRAQRDRRAGLPKAQQTAQ